MVCPQCNDRPPLDQMNESEKKKGSTIKDKEKNKRMKGQSSHATWKSETEMQLRQQFDWRQIINSVDCTIFSLVFCSFPWIFMPNFESINLTVIVLCIMHLSSKQFKSTSLFFM